MTGANDGGSTVGYNAHEGEIEWRMLEVGGMYSFDTIASIFQVKER